MILNIPLEIYQAANKKDIFNYLMHYEGICYRHEKDRKTSRIEIAGQDYFIKQHKKIRLSEILKSLLQLRKPVLGAKNEWRALRTCEAINVPTAKAIGFGARNCQSFVIMQALNNTKSLEEICGNWAKEKPEFQFKRKVIKQVAILTRRFHQAGMVHRDLYLCHFLLENFDPNKMVLIDLHRVEISKKTSHRNLVKDLAALFYSSLNYGFSANDYYYFIQQYTGKPIREFIHTKLSQAIIKKAVKLYIKDYGYKPSLPFGKKTLIERLNRGNPTILLPDLIFSSLLRVIPNKRWVFSGNWQNKKVAIKIFASKRKYEQELAGITLCNAAQIATPRLLYQSPMNLRLPLSRRCERSEAIQACEPGLLRFARNDGYTILGGSIFILVFEWIEQNKVTLHDLVPLVANHHNHQLIQEDIHIDNFVKKENQIITLDAGSIRKASEKDCLDNFSLLLAQFWSLTPKEIKIHTEQYCALRNLSAQEIIPDLIKQVEIFKQKRKKQKLEKIFRTCSDITCFKTWGKTILIRNDSASPELCFLLQHIEDFYKKQKTNYTIQRDTKWIWQKSQASILWRKAHLQEWLGEKITKPVAFIEKRNFLKKIAYYID